MSEIVYLKIDYVKNRRNFLTRYPDLEKLYLYDDTVHIVVDSVCINPVQENLLDTIKQLLVINNRTNALLMEAIKQGYIPNK